MSDFKEFQGKDLDEAIESACQYFNLKRDRLEIEILAGGSSGIFGIMGVKKAKVQARPRVQVNATDILNGDDKAPAKPKKSAPKKSAPKKAEPQPKQEDETAPQSNSDIAPEEDADEINGNVVEPEVDPADDVNGNMDPELYQKQKQKQNKKRDRKPKKQNRSRENNTKRDRKPKADKPQAEKPRKEERPRANMDDFDHEVLKSTTLEVMSELLTPIVGETTVEVTIESDRIKVFIDDDENSGLIIGREGQTLSSIQYLVNRLVSRKMEASVRIQVDTGDYRERQDDKLRQVAEHLAEKAADLGRTQSTKPLSSYHRRVVHLALQDNEEVFTRSKGDGPMKRVLIVPKSRKNNRNRR